MGQLNIIIDRRTELMAIVLALSECNAYAEEHFNLSICEEYRKQVLSHFSCFKNHNAVLLAKELGNVEEGFNYDNPILLALQLEEDLTFKGSVCDYLLSELDNEKLVKEFLSEMEIFAKASKFDEFYESEQKYYQSKLQELESIINGKDVLRCIENTLKMSIENKFVVNIIPSLINSNHGFNINGVIYACLGLPCEDFKNIDKFNNGYLHIVLHEFLHPFVNPNTERCLKQIKDVSVEINQMAKKSGYGNKISIINDTIVRALAIRIREKLSSIDTKKFLIMEKNCGFSKVEDVYNAILNFERQDLNWNDYFINFLNLIFGLTY